MMLPEGTTRVAESPPATAAARCLFLLSPTGAGIHAVVRRINELGYASVELSTRYSTRSRQSWDNGTLNSISESEFHAALNRKEFLAVTADGSGFFYGIRRADVAGIISRGAIPVLRGLPGHASELKSQFAAHDPAVRVVTIFMVTDPPDAWRKVVEDRRFDVEGRISAAEKILEDVGMDKGDAAEAYMGKRYGIDHLVVNRWGHLDETARTIADLLR